MPLELDDTDLVLLDSLQRDARTGMEALSEAAGLSVASVHRRLKRLREQGVITGEVALVDERALGAVLTLLVQVEIGTENAHRAAEFKRHITAFDEVQQAYHVTGEMDFLLVVKVADMPHYERFMEKAFYGHDNVRRFKTSVTLSTLKQGATVPLYALRDAR